MRTAVTGRPVSAAPKASDRIARSGSSGTRPIVSATTPVLDSRGPKLGDSRRPNPTDAPGGTDRTHGARTANLDPDDGSSEARPSFSFSGGIQTRSRDP